MRYRKRPVEVDAVYLTESSLYFVVAWMRDKADESGPYVRFGYGRDEDGAYVTIPTLEGTMTAREGDYVIRGVKGEFYPCRGDIFEETYEAVVR